MYLRNKNNSINLFIYDISACATKNTGRSPQTKNFINTGHTISPVKKCCKEPQLHPHSMSLFRTSTRLRLFLFTQRVVLKSSDVCLHEYWNSLSGRDTLGLDPHKYWRRFLCQTSTHLKHNWKLNNTTSVWTLPQVAVARPFTPGQFEICQKCWFRLVGFLTGRGILQVFKKRIVSDIDAQIPHCDHVFENVRRDFHQAGVAEAQVKHRTVDTLKHSGPQFFQPRSCQSQIV